MGLETGITHYRARARRIPDLRYSVSGSASAGGVVSGEGVGVSAGAVSVDAGSVGGEASVALASTGVVSAGVATGAAIAGAGAGAGAVARSGADGAPVIGNAAVVSLNDSKIFIIGLSAVLTMMRR